MLKTFTIRNFRSFGDVTIGPLAQVNLITGKNGIGKTALLEALMIHVNPYPGIASTINHWRGMEQVGLEATRMWGWLFHERRTSNPIELESVDARGTTRSLAISLTSAESSDSGEEVDGWTIPPIDAEMATISGMPKELLFRYRDSSGRSREARALVKDDHIVNESSGLRPFGTGIFIIATSQAGYNEIERLSRIEMENRQHDVVSSLQQVEPRLRRLTVLVTAGKPMIYADIGLEKLVPFQLVGHGLGRLLTILLAIAEAKKGVVLVDEIENGIHYSAMNEAWKAIFFAAHRFDVQIFATTHSWECIYRAHEASETSDAYDLRVHRLESLDGTIRAVTADSEALGAVLKAELEIR